MSYILFINEKLSNPKCVHNQSNEFDRLNETLQNHVANWQISVVIQYESFKLSETVPAKEGEGS